MYKKLMLACAVSLTLAGAALAEGGGGPESNWVGWLLNPGPIVSAPAARRLAPFAEIQARATETQSARIRSARGARAVPWAFR